MVGIEKQKCACTLAQFIDGKPVSDFRQELFSVQQAGHIIGRADLFQTLHQHRQTLVLGHHMHDKGCSDNQRDHCGLDHS